MNNGKKTIIILLAEDDPDDRILIRDALAKCNLVEGLICVEDGDELMDYLKRRGKYQTPKSAPRPDLILLDLNMPKKNGYEVLKEIKSDPELQDIPVVVLTVSSSEEDILQTYKMGASSYITKPVTFDGLINTMKMLVQYWFHTVKIPPKSRNDNWQMRENLRHPNS
ncbi:response regulator [Candidatus Sumerlaeota bacterium]|nr:response regulator [Candidatus Sumerlaeota bacterium]